MELLEYWQIVRKRSWLIALIMAVALAGRMYLSLQEVPRYRTTTTLFLNPAAQSPILPYQTSQSVESLASTYARLMRTRSFASAVAQQTDASVGEVLGALSTGHDDGTQFFSISATHTDPKKAQELANTAAQVLIAQNLARQQAQKKQIEAQRDPLKAQEQQRLRRLQQSLEDKLDYYDKRVAALETQITELEGGLRSEDVDQRILALREELTRNESLAMEALSSLGQIQASLAGIQETPSVDTAIVVDEAPLPAAPLPRDIVRQILTALIVAFGAGFGISYLLEYVDYTVKTPEELDAVYDMATLGVIGLIEGGARSGGGGRRRQIVTLTDPRSPIAEAFRSLRTNIQFASPDEPVRSLLITSAGPREGKTLTSANLAVSLAQGGSRVILVDADLRKPRQHRLFEVPKEPGFTNLIIDQRDEPSGPHPPNPPLPTPGEGGTDRAQPASLPGLGGIEGEALDGYLKRTSQENLWILPCGAIPPNPAELLGSPRAAQVMQQLKEHADVVVYDSPPAATVTDAVIMASRVDGVIQVVQAGKTRRDLVLRGRDVLGKVGAHILGPVLNRVQLSDLGYYSYYYAYGYYSDGREPEDEERSLLGRLLPGGRRSREKRKRGKGNKEIRE